jgi:serine phosphatase RsbU (regulator of sigma subunit)
LASAEKACAAVRLSLVGGRAGDDDMTMLVLRRLLPG